MTDCAGAERTRRSRPGGRSARVRHAVLVAAGRILAERGYDGLELTEVARLAGVHPTTVYRRWATKAHLVGEALLEEARPLSPTPDTGSVAGDLEQLLRDGSMLLQQPAARALFGVLLSESINPPPEVRDARRRFWRAHADEAQALIDRGIARGELPPEADPLALIDLVIGPALVRLLLLGRELEPEETRSIVQRALVAMRA